MTVSQAHKAPSRATDYAGVRQASPTATSPVPAVAPYGNAAAQEPVGAAAVDSTPLLDSVADRAADLTGDTIDPFSEMPGPWEDLDRSIGVGGPKPARISGSLDTTRGMDDGLGARDESGATVSVFGNQVDAGVRWDDLHRDGEHTLGTSKSVGGRMGGSGFGVAAAYSATAATDGGEAHTLGQSMALTSDGTLSGSLSSTTHDADGNSGNTGSVFGSVRVGEGTGKLTAGAGLAGPKNKLKAADGSDAGFSKWSARGQGGLSWRWRKPRRTETGWSVDYEIGVSVGGGAGVTRGAPKGMGSVTASLDAQVERTSSGTVAFPDEAAAQAFYASPDPSLAIGPTSDVDQARAMHPGSSARSELGVSLGGGLSGSAQGIALGIGAGGTIASGIEVERLEGERVRVTVDQTRAGQLAGSFGAGPIAIMGDAQAVGTGSTSWQLDLATPGGAAAYQDMLSGRTPDFTADGVQFDAFMESAAAASSLGANVAGLSAKVGSTASETTRIDAQGRRTEEALGTADTDAGFGAASWFDWLPWQSHVGLAATTQTDRDGTELANEVEGRATVRGGNAKANYETLGQAAGTHTWAGHRGAGTDGTWNVDVDFGDNSLDDLIEIVTDPSFSPARAHVDASILELADALKAAGTDREKQRAAVKAYGRGGSEAIDALRRLLSDEQVFVGLEGSGTWIGEAGWERVETRVAWMVDNTETAPQRVEQQANDMIVEHQARLWDLTDYGRYDDVPATVRNEEIERTKKLLERLRGLLPDDAADFAGPTIEGSVAAVREEMEKRYEWVRNRQEAHGLGDTGGFTHRSRLGDTGWFGFGAGPELAAYGEAEALVLSGEEARRMGNAAETKAGDLVTQGEAQAAAVAWRDAIGHYERAEADFRTSFEAYTGIQKRHGISR